MVVECLSNRFDDLKKVGAPGGIRTPNPQIRSLMLYPVELRARLELSFDFEQIARRHHNTEANIAETVRSCAVFYS
jgi:hypothetical protein